MIHQANRYVKTLQASTRVLVGCLDGHSVPCVASLEVGAQVGVEVLAELVRGMVGKHKWVNHMLIMVKILQACALSDECREGKIQKRGLGGAIRALGKLNSVDVLVGLIGHLWVELLGDDGLEGLKGCLAQTGP